MALDLFRISLGIALEDADGTERAAILTGSGAPGGDAARQDDASVGSIYLRTDASGSISATWQKIADGNETADWVQSASKDYVDAAVSGLSWREPALVLDSTTYANIAAAEAAVDATGTASEVDGVTITAGDKILFTDLTTGNENLYIASGSFGSWTFTEDTNTATDGDAVLIQSGTSADQQWVYDGTNWVQFGGASSTLELGYLRTFMGKTAAGSETPTYSSTNYITTGNSLEIAIGDLDSQVGTNAGSISTNAGNISTNTGAISTINTNIGTLLYTEENFVTDSESITTSIDALDIALAANALNRSTGTTITSATTIDTVLVDDYQAVKWFIAIFDEGDTDQKFAAEIWALHDGNVSGDATEVDWNEVSKLKINGDITGLGIEVVLNGTGAAQTMGLQITSTDVVTVFATRVDVQI